MPATVTSPSSPFAWVRPLMPRIVIGALIAAALVAVYSVIVGEFGPVSQHLLGTIAVFVFFALISWYDAEVSARRAPWFGLVSLIVTVCLFVDGLVKLWVPVAPDSKAASWGFLSWIAVVIIVRVGLLHVHLVLNTQRRFWGPVMNVVRGSTLALVGILTVMIVLPLLFLDANFSEAYWRVVAIVAILDALGTILIPLTYSLFASKIHGDQSWEQPQSGFGEPVLAPAFAGSASGAPGPSASGFAPAAAAAPAADASVADASAFAPPTATATPTPAPVARGFAAPSAEAYPRLVVGRGLQLEWPRYINGQPLPAAADGTPDFEGVVGYARGSRLR